MFNKNLLAIATGAALLVGAQVASAGSVPAGTANYDITLQPSCTAVVNGSSFGTHAVDAGILYNANAGQVEVTCSAGTLYRIMFDGGDNGDGSFRKMALPDGSVEMGYTLYEAETGREVGDADPLDVEAYSPTYQRYLLHNGIENTATGAAITHYLTADVDIPSAGTIAGHYTDSVGVAITY